MSNCNRRDGLTQVSDMQTALLKNHRVRFRTRWIDIAGLMTILSVTGFTFFSFPPEDERRWVVLGLLVVFTIVQLVEMKHAEAGPQHLVSHGVLAVLVILNMGLFWSNANPLSVVILFFVLSVHAMELLSTRLAFIWIGLFGLCTVAMLATVMQPAFAGVLNGLGALGGYCFLGFAATAQHRAEQANEESKRLLDELRVAHQQLRHQANQAEELVISRERNRLAREVHDTLGHRLTVAAVQLEGAQRLIQRDPDKAINMIHTVRQQVMEGLTELRQTVATLRMRLDDELPFAQALTGLVQQFEKATELTLHLDMPEPLTPLPADYRQALYRTIQEALTNIQKHAQAQVVSVRVEQRSNADRQPVLQVTVEDDGVGLADNADLQGFGLRGLRERAEQLNGYLSLETPPPGGTRLTMTLPLDLEP